MLPTLRYEEMRRESAHIYDKLLGLDDAETEERTKSRTELVTEAIVERLEADGGYDEVDIDHLKVVSFGCACDLPAK